MKILAIIPARGGSKGVPKKNIKNMAGKPLIAWTIKLAHSSGLFDSVIVSTDDAEISNVALKHGADVPFLRPLELAQDDTPTLPVVVHAVDWLKKNKGMEYEYIVLLEPTFPMRTEKHISEAIKLLHSSGADSVVSVVPTPGHFNPHWQFTIDKDNTPKIFTGEDISDITTQRQKLPVTYTRNGAIYAFKTELLFEKKPSLYGRKVQAYIMGEEYDVDIDTTNDWNHAEKKMDNINKK